MIQFQACQDLFVADTASRVFVHDVDQLGNGALSITHNVAGNTFGDRHQFIIHHQHAVIHALDKTLHQDAFSARVLTGRTIRLP